MQTTHVHIHPCYAIFVLGTFFGIDIGTLQSILVANTLSNIPGAYDASNFWISALWGAVSFLMLGAVATNITGMVSRGILTTFWSSLVAGFIIFITSFVVVTRRLDLIPYASFEHTYDPLSLFIYFFGFFCLWLFVMFFGLSFGSAGAGLYRAIQKIATRFNCAGQVK